MFRVFGCLAFASTLHAHRLKFDPKARICIFLGYPTSIKGYKLYDIKTKEIFFSKDVNFHENIFPFHSITPLEDLIEPLPTCLPVPVQDTYLPQIAPSSAPPPADTHTPFPSLNLPPPISHASPDHTSHDPIVPQHPQSSHTRRSNRLIKPPSYLKDFHCNLTIDNSHCRTPYPVSQYLSYDSLSPSHKHFFMAISSNYEPQYYHQALPYQHWREAMQTEQQAMELNKTWSVVPLPPGKHTICSLTTRKTHYWLQMDI